MIIAQISDTHILAQSDDPGPNSRVTALRRCIADINRQGVDAVIHTGDSVHGGSAEDYALLRDILADLNAPYFPIPGNRDVNDVMRAAFADLAFIPRDGDHILYAVDDFPVRLVGLDSTDVGERKGAFCADRAAWLDETLAEKPDKPTLLFMHHPPFDIADHYVGGYRRPHEAGDLTAVVSRHPQVVRLLCGHVHCLHRESWGGTVATTMPSVAIDLRMTVDDIDAAPVYTLHRVTDDGVVSELRVLVD